uniref:Uncharacterized protein n=1 Tax=Magallana gigas TaxID=29159 RepID=K1PIL9_MAGGI
MSALEKELRQLHDGLPKTAEKSHARDSGIPDSRHTTLLGEKSYKSSGAKPKQLKKTTSFLGDDEPSFVENLNELTSRKQRRLSCSSYDAVPVQTNQSPKRGGRRKETGYPLSELDFLRLDEDQLRELTCGTYQVKLASSYAEEHFGNGCDIMVHKEDPSLIRVRIRSRHISSKSYLLWIRYDEGSVIGWYCRCDAGARVVGMCAHIAAVLWYIGLGRDMDSFRSVRDWSKFIDDAAVIPDAIDESESEDYSSECLNEQ